MKNFFNPLFGEIRAEVINNKLYFVAKDIARVLGYVEGNNRVKTGYLTRLLPERDILYLGGAHCAPQDIAVLITEGGFYRAILKRTPSENNPLKAHIEAFENWVVEEILPSVRQYGMYATGMEDLNPKEKEVVSETARKQIAFLQKRRHELWDDLRKSEGLRKEYKARVKKAEANYSSLLQELAEVEEYLNKERCKYNNLFNETVLASLHKPLSEMKEEPISESTRIYVDAEGFLSW